MALNLEIKSLRFIKSYESICMYNSHAEHSGLSCYISVSLERLVWFFFTTVNELESFDQPLRILCIFRPDGNLECLYRYKYFEIYKPNYCDNLTYLAFSGSTSTTSSSGCSSGSPMMNSNHPNHHNSITYNKVIEMAAQIAAAMKYLQGRNIVHKDLAAR